jgi:hypothetical protein
LDWLWRGALSWVVALIAKLALMVPLGLAGAAIPAWLYGFFAGVISAASELGLAWLALARAASDPGLFDVLLFAAAAGSIEALALVMWTILVRTPNAEKLRWLEAASVSPLVKHQFLVERSIAWFGHLGSRSLLALAVVHQVPALGLVAFVTFAVTDGMAAFESQRGADWLSPPVLARYFRVALLVVALELAVLIGCLKLL